MNDICFQFKQQTLYRGTTPVLRQLDLQIAQGETVALLGRSGAGKSTLLDALRAQQADQVAWCPQDGALVPMLSVFHNIYMGGLHRHSALYNLTNLIWPLPTERDAVQQLADVLGIGEKLRTSVDRLSGGQAQRTALGRALYTQRSILLGDEPVSSVDDHQAVNLLELALSRHQTAVVALHDRTLALGCFDRIIGLKDGLVMLDAHASTLSLRDLDALY